MISAQSNRVLLLSAVAIGVMMATTVRGLAQSNYATSDSMSGYVHWIDLYDADNKKIDPEGEFPRPYSPEKTCGRCHDYKQIAHGWHFNAVDADSIHGRPGQPWIWADERSGTFLPLSYRGWKGTFNPDDLGLSRWQVAAKLGGFLPGGGPGSEESLAEAAELLKKLKATRKVTPVDGEEDELPPGYEDRSNVTGPLPVDCMMCHHRSGSGYSPFVWTEQVEEENFAYAPTAALGIAVVSGNSRRLKDDFDPTAEGAQEKLPKVDYSKQKFRSDGKVFFDLIRKPDNDACYYCHTNSPTETVGGGRWLHDEDIHVRAGIKCADCHRNGLDHHTVRGFDGENHPSGDVVSLSCAGCHLGTDQSTGRLGAPRPLHKGLPPLHFEKMTCTACHAGSMPADEIGFQINSIAHRLGEHVKRTGEEAPGIAHSIIIPMQSSVIDDDQAKGSEEPEPADKSNAEDAEDVAEANSDAKSDADASPNAWQGDGRFAPHRMMWPSYWAIKQNDEITPLNPEMVYDLVRRSLKVRREFTEELGDAKLSLSERKKLLGDDRARVKEDERTDEEAAIIAKAEAEARTLQVNERIAKSLADIEEAFPGAQAIFISGGMGFVRDQDASTEDRGEENAEEGDAGNDEEDEEPVWKIKTLDASQLGDAAAPYAWPQAHNVRPAQQSLGVSGCTECHSEKSKFFGSVLTPVGLLPDQETQPIAIRDLQQVDQVKLAGWNSLFQGRSLFKVLGLIALGLTCVVAVAFMAINLNDMFRRNS